MTWTYWAALSPRTTTGRSGIAALRSRSFCSSSSIVTGTASTKILPASLMVIATVFGLARLGVSLALGRSTLMPCTEAVVMMMKMTSSTYARSSIGVMLTSSYGLSSCIFMEALPCPER
jgi:hypothetical protein